MVSLQQFQIKFHPKTTHHSVTGSEDEERLVRDLFRGYNKLIRPVQNMTQKVDVRFGLAFVQLINVVSAKLSGSNFVKLIFPCLRFSRTRKIRL